MKTEGGQIEFHLAGAVLQAQFQERFALRFPDESEKGEFLPVERAGEFPDSRPEIFSGRIAVVQHELDSVPLLRRSGNIFRSGTN